MIFGLWSLNERKGLFADCPFCHFVILPFCVDVSNAGIGYTDGTRLTAYFGEINYVTVDGAGNVYIGDHFDDGSGDPGLPLNSIRRLAIATGNVTTMAGKGRESALALH